MKSIIEKQKNIIAKGNEKMKDNKLTKLFICLGIIAVLVVLFIIAHKAISTKPVEIVETEKVVEPEQIETEAILESEETANEELSTEEISTETTDEIESAEAELTEEIEYINSDDYDTTEPVAEPTEQTESTVADYIVEEVSATMYATQTVNVRDLPTTEGNKVGSKSYAEVVEVIGKVTSYKGESCLWYQLSDGTFVSGNYLTETKPTVTTNKTNTGSTNNSSSTSTPSNNSSNNSNNNGTAQGGISQDVWDAFFSDNGGQSTDGGQASLGDSSYGGGAHIN
mgnify:CR=1 FL=1